MPPIIHTFSDEINYLVWRYLQETNLGQAAWALEAEIKTKSGKDVVALHEEVGRTLSFDLQKRLRMSMQYQEVLKHMSEDGDLPCTAPFTLLSEHKCNKGDDSRVPIPDVLERPWQLEPASFPHAEPLQLTNAIQQPRQSRRLNRDENGGSLGVPNAFTKARPPTTKRRKPNNNVPPNSLAVGIVEEEESNVDDEMDEDTVVMNGEDVVMKDVNSVKSEAETIQVIPNDGPVQFGDSNTLIAAWNDKSILATGQDGMVNMWTVHPRGGARIDKQNVSLPNNTSGHVTSICWHPNDSLLAAGTISGLTTIWNVDGSLRASLPSLHGPIFNVKFNPSGSMLVTCSAGGVFEIYTTRDWTSMFTVPPPVRVWELPDNIPHLAWLDDSRVAILATNTPHAVVNCWQFDDTPAPEPFLQLSGHEAIINDIQYDKYIDLIATASDDQTVRLWKTDRSVPYHEFRHHGSSVRSVAFQPQTDMDSSTRILASASFDGTICLCDVTNLTHLYTFGNQIHNFPHDRISCITWSPDGKFLCSGDLEGVVGVWEWRGSSEPRPYAIWAPDRIAEEQSESLTNGMNGHKDELGRPVFRIHWQRNGQSFVVCRENRRVALIDWPLEQHNR